MKMTKLELRTQQVRLKQLQRYLPTLQLKKGLLQVHVFEARQKLMQVEEFLHLEKNQCEAFAPLLNEPLCVDLLEILRVQNLSKREENIAGIELPLFERVDFAAIDYSLVDTPVWLDSVVIALRRLKRLHIEREICMERLQKLEKELQEVSTRVNLFEKILIPRTLGAIRKIGVFLGDLQLAAVARAKVAKSKIKMRKDACRT